MDRAESAWPVIAITGVCAAGKSTLAAGLRSLGYQAFSVPQEHSAVRRLWVRRSPDVLVLLDATWETVKRRRPDSAPSPERLAAQRERLAYARAECDLYLPTDDLTVEQVRDAVVRFVQTARGPARPA